MDLRFGDTQMDFMTKFVDCLVRLPNLRTLDVFDTSRSDLVARGLEQKCVRFPGVRELWVSNNTVKFAGSCPNVKSIIAPHGLGWHYTEILSSYRKTLGKLESLMGADNFLGELRDTFLSE